MSKKRVSPWAARDLEVILDECLNQIEKGESVEACAAQYPALSAELVPLLRIARQCQTLGETIVPPPAALRAGRQKLLTEAARLKSAAENKSRTAPASLWSSMQVLLRKSAVVATLISVLLVTVLGGTTIAASANSLPGDALYPVKRITEDLQLALTFEQQAKAQLLQKFDERRRQEAIAILDSQRIAELSFRGHLERQDGNRWTVGGVPLLVSEETVIEGTIELGAWVHAYTRSLSDGTLRAMRIVVEPEPLLLAPTASPTPTEEATIPPTPTEELASPTTRPVTALPIQPPPSPTVTPTLTPRPSATSSPTPTATPIPPTPTPTREIKVRFKGKIEAINATAWTIGGQIVRINANTRIQDQEERAAVGVMATVLAVREADGTLLAVEIITERAAPTPEQLFEFQGLIESFGPTQWVVSGYTLLITANTVVEGSPQKGLLAEVKAVRQSDGSLRATRITVILPSEEIQFEGSIQALSTGEWIVDGTIVRMNAQTAIIGTPAVGSLVEIQGFLLADGAVLARKIVVQPAATLTPVSSRPVVATTMRAAPLLQPQAPYGHTIEFRGVIQEIDDLYWIVSERIVFVTESTVIYGRPQVGALAEVKGTRSFGEAVLAKSIKITVPGAYERVEFEGTLESIWGNTWVVGGVTVTISPVTVIQGTPVLGLTAEVQGVLQPDGSVLAERIIIRGPSSEPQIDIAGIVESIEPTRWIISRTTVWVDAQTFIDDSRAPAEVGMWAQVRALRRPDGSLLALRIRLARPD